jgi:hypothetical protein
MERQGKLRVLGLVGVRAHVRRRCGAIRTWMDPAETGKSIRMDKTAGRTSGRGRRFCA